MFYFLVTQRRRRQEIVGTKYSRLWRTSSHKEKTTQSTLLSLGVSGAPALPVPRALHAFLVIEKVIRKQSRNQTVRAETHGARGFLLRRKIDGVVSLGEGMGRSALQTLRRPKNAFAKSLMTSELSS